MYSRSRRLSVASTALKMATLDKPVQIRMNTQGSDHQLLLTALVDVVFALRDLLAIHNASNARLFSNITIALAENDELVTRKIVLLDGLANDDFRCAITVDIGCIPSSQAAIVCRLEYGKRLFDMPSGKQGTRYQQ